MHTLISWNKRSALATDISEANRIARTLIAFGAVNVSILPLTALEVSEMIDGGKL